MAIDEELSRDCLAHAKYLVKNVDPKAADEADVYEEDAGKPGYSIEGQCADRRHWSRLWNRCRCWTAGWAGFRGE